MIATVLAANDAFYAAFSAGDLNAMDAMWAREHAVSCTHPGREALESRENVMASWQLIFRARDGLHARAEGASVCLSGAMAVVICYEKLGTASGRTLGVLAATNVFIREGDAWRLVHHHASGITSPDDDDDDDADDSDETPGAPGGVLN